ncbi:Bug family tripartite tricarboxylate transporter substrate binding protein [Histidinibacterium aquaticum]|uniref:Tripartite tricarboxylate transporter substrate binding protein n=1 Tax=Histidinibacterium aquaticum TaxID=2613962 RepID=A0A5J5GKE2_9RHOB|nr:tripartite tricarboxylate transporter substrate binding protein [Histidinibacterium aquaticum]KAA9008133.1 tripartite tricarboxylate transporter substrate binding protein [Histidinibacterium aquaticum]
MTLKKLLLATTLSAGAAVPGLAQEDFPTRQIEFVTPYPPGGSHSLHAGIITTAAEPHFGVSLVSVIRAGGGGAVGATEVAQADPDGYTLLFGDPTINSLRPQVEDLAYDIDDFVPVARINYSPAIFVARADSPFSTLEEMVTYAEENPGDLTYSSDNLNGWTYTVFELLKARSGADMTGVEYGGGGPAVARLLGGETMAYAGDISVVGEHIESGDLVPLCVTDTERMEALPEVPTCPEAGYDVVFQFWRGAMAPAGTPPEVIAELSDSFEALMEDEGFLRLIGRIGSSIQFADHEEFAELWASEVEAMAAVAEMTGAAE